MAETKAPAAEAEVASENGESRANDRTKRKDDGRTEKQHKNNKNCCHTHGWDVCDGHDSARCYRPDKFHDATATNDNFKGGCDLYRRLSHKSMKPCEAKRAN